MKKILFLAATVLLLATGVAEAKSVKLGAADDGADRQISVKSRPSVTCKAGKVLKDGKCISCSDEVAHCKTCSAESKCLRCETNYDLKSDGTCGCANDSVCDDLQYCWKKNCTSLACKKGFYGKNHKCNACPTGSADCKYDDSKPGVVSTECKRGYYLKDGECLPCSVFSSEYSNCRACTESGCTECDGDGPENGKCVDCSDDDSCAGTQKCVSNKCEELDCGPVAPQDHTCPVCADYGYTTGCANNENTTETGVVASDGTCYTCEMKTCEQLGYPACTDGQDKEAAGVSGSDGACYTCVAAGRENGCSDDDDCGACQKCSSNGQCEAVSCGSGQQCDNNHGCKDGGGSGDDDDAECKRLCGSKFYYDHTGLKNGGKERVCTYYPKSCGYGCTTGWDIDYLVQGTNYTCQTARQTEKEKTCTIGSYSECPTGTVCDSQKGETACHTCNQGSNVSTTFKCNCPSDTLSDGNGGCTKKSTGNSNSNSGSNTGSGSGSNTGSNTSSKSSSSGGSCKNFAHYGGCAGAPSVCEYDAASDYGKVCTSGSQCAKGRCAPCSTVTNSTQQGSTCR